MMHRLHQINLTFFAPDRGEKDPAACEAAVKKYGGYWGPFVDVGLERDGVHQQEEAALSSPPPCA